MNARVPRGPEVCLRRAGEGFVLGGKVFPRFPVLVDGGGVVLPAADYLTHVALFRNLAAGSLDDVAYALRAWFGFLLASRIDWRDADDLLLRTWAVREEGRSNKRRVARKVGVVFDFYRTAQSRLGWLDGVVGSGDAVLTGGPRHPISYDIVVRRRRDGTAVRREVPSFRYPTLPQSLPRPTPSGENVERIADRALALSNAERAECWWLCVRWMHLSGLRCAGVAGLTLAALSEALAQEGIVAPDGSPWRLSEIDGDHGAQDAIKQGIADLRERGRKAAFVLVIEKRRKARRVPLPFEMLENNLDYVWGNRADLVRARFAERQGWKDPDALFLSLKTGLAFEPKSIGNMIKSVFKRLSVPGSAHRLRAVFAQATVRAAYLKARAIHGRNVDKAAVLLDAAEKMGHEKPETLRPYLNRAIQEDNEAPGEPVLVSSSEDASMLRALADLMEEGDPRVARQVRDLLEKLGVEPRFEDASVDDVRRTIARRAARGLKAAPDFP